MLDLVKGNMNMNVSQSWIGLLGEIIWKRNYPISPKTKVLRWEPFSNCIWLFISFEEWRLIVVMIPVMMMEIVLPIKLLLGGVSSSHSFDTGINGLQLSKSKMRLQDQMVWVPEMPIEEVSSFIRIISQTRSQLPSHRIRISSHKFHPKLI